jgi:hypothetical protein
MFCGRVESWGLRDTGCGNDAGFVERVGVCRIRLWILMILKKTFGVFHPSLAAPVDPSPDLRVGTS